jgi:hypothetical protein
VEDGVIDKEDGHNSRYIKISYLQPQEKKAVPAADKESAPQDSQYQIEQLRQRLRIQEMALANLQERLADLEEKHI